MLSSSAVSCLCINKNGNLLFGRSLLIVISTQPPLFFLTVYWHSELAETYYFLTIEK